MHGSAAMASLYEHARLTRPEQQALLARIVARCQAKPDRRPPVVVFDLDGTLMDNRPRTAAILQELARELEDPGTAKVLGAARADELAYLLTDTLKRLGIEHPETVQQAQSFWKERFFADGYLKHDVAIEGSVEFARACYDAGATIVYFTGRDLPAMSLGSFQSLRDLGFPIGLVGTELVCKPDFNTPDESFKRDVGLHLRRVGDVVAAFDNEPGNCNAFLEMYPDAESIFVDTQHLPGAPKLHPKVHVIPDIRMK